MFGYIEPVTHGRHWKVQATFYATKHRLFNQNSTLNIKLAGKFEFAK
jgi:hypothetical protein